MSEAPDQDYYPSWKARLTVRLQDFDAGALRSKVPPKDAKIMNGVKDSNSGVEAVPDPDFPGRFLLRNSVTKEVLDAAIQRAVAPETSSDDLTQVIGGVIPKRFDWKQNGFRTADELKIAIRWADMPIDPRCICSCAVEFYLGTLTRQEYAQGMRGLTRGDVFGPGAPNAFEPMSLVPDTYASPSGGQRSNLRFQGFVDKWKMVWGDDEPVIELECADLTRLLLNQLAPAKLVVGAKEALDKAIAVYLSNFPQFAGMTVEYRGPEGATAPVLEKTLAGTAFRPELGPQPGKGSGDDLVVWDYLTDVAGAVGHVIYVDGTRVVLARPSTILDGQGQTRPDDPYRTRKLDSGEYPARAMIVGRNVKELEISRDLASGETKNVEVRCWSPRRKQVLVARFPKKDSRIATSTPGDQAAENKWTIVRVSGIENQQLLEQMAEDYYNGRNRNEIEAVIKTKDLASFGGGNADPDLLDLRAGDPVELLLDRGRQFSLGQTEKDLTAQGANQKVLTDLGFSSKFAAAYARVYANAGFQKLFRVREMNVTGDLDEGVSFEIRAANFVQVRGEVKK